MDIFFLWKSVRTIKKEKKSKKGSQWVRNQENIMDRAKSHSVSQWASAVSFWQYVAEQCHKAKLWASLNNKCTTSFFKGV